MTEDINKEESVKLIESYNGGSDETNAEEAVFVPSEVIKELAEENRNSLEEFVEEISKP